jgi:hypothetical protein
MAGVRVLVSALATALSVAACAAPARQAAPPAVPPPEELAVWPPRMPCALDLDTVPLGRWAEYEETYLGSVTIKERVALVGKGAEGNTIETTTEMPSRDKTVFATVFAAPNPDSGVAASPRVVRNVFQVGDAEPMESPSLGAAEQPYPRVDPSKLVGVDTIRVRAGTFRAKHYRDRTAYAEQVDFWIDDSVGPIGLIKLDAEQKQHPTIHAGFQFELVATGNTAIAQITKPAQPFDAAVLKKRGLPWTRQSRVGPQPPAKVVQ